MPDDKRVIWAKEGTEKRGMPSLCENGLEALWDSRTPSKNVFVGRVFEIENP